MNLRDFENLAYNKPKKEKAPAGFVCKLYSILFA